MDKEKVQKEKSVTEKRTKGVLYIVAMIVVLVQISITALTLFAGTEVYLDAKIVYNQGTGLFDVFYECEEIRAGFIKGAKQDLVVGDSLYLDIRQNGEYGVQTDWWIFLLKGTVKSVHERDDGVGYSVSYTGLPKHFEISEFQMLYKNTQNRSHNIEKIKIYFNMMGNRLVPIQIIQS